MENPTYRAMGDHTEAVSIDYDPTVLSYEELLTEFWAGHCCDSINRGRQYMKAIFYRNDQQQQLAEDSLRDEAQRAGKRLEQVTTSVLPVNHFTYAEAYHQKYSLSRSSEVRLYLEGIYSTGKEFADSAVATRLNAFLGSGMKKDWPTFLEQLPTYGLPDSLRDSIAATAQSRL